jgi:hypothetical protein
VVVVEDRDRPFPVFGRVWFEVPGRKRDDEIP